MAVQLEVVSSDRGTVARGLSERDLSRSRPLLPLPRTCKSCSSPMAIAPSVRLSALLGVLASAAAFCPSSGVLIIPSARVRSAAPILQARHARDADARRAARAAARPAQAEPTATEPTVAHVTGGQGIHASRGQPEAFQSPMARHTAGLVRAGLKRGGQNALLDEPVALALAEFVRSDYARSLCQYCNVNPSDHGRIEGVFESVWLLDGGKLDIKLRTPVQHRSEQLLGRLAAHLRARAPHIRQMQYEIGGGWGTTRRWYLRVTTAAAVPPRDESEATRDACVAV